MEDINVSNNERENYFNDEGSDNWSTSPTRDTIGTLYSGGDYRSPFNSTKFFLTWETFRGFAWKILRFVKGYFHCLEATMTLDKSKGYGR